ncbi:cyclic nucleotide-binding domain-containing protein [Embleya sp. NPDC059259]|uniref:cyclic nucleotide-binding domain-containing protein n=1 Tax=unclassified Embleya TaxID=2699296 RepID=UPI0036C0BE85
MTVLRHGFLGALGEGPRDRLIAIARDASFPDATRVFEENGPADRFWVVRSGLVALDIHVPGRRDAVVETLGPDELLGWSWLFQPYRWHLGASSRGAVLAYEFDAGEVRAMCDEDPTFGVAVNHCVAQVIARRLKATRMRLLDLYGRPSGPSPAPSP